MGNLYFTCTLPSSGLPLANGRSPFRIEASLWRESFQNRSLTAEAPVSTPDCPLPGDFSTVRWDTVASYDRQCKSHREILIRSDRRAVPHLIWTQPVFPGTIAGLIVKIYFGVNTERDENRKWGELLLKISCNLIKMCMLAVNRTKVWKIVPLTWGAESASQTPETLPEQQELRPTPQRADVYGTNSLLRIKTCL